VPQDYLGLFDTPPSRKHLRYSMAIVGLLFVILIAILALPEVPVGQIDAFIPMVGASTALVDLVIATLFYAQATVFQSRALSALGTGYVFTGLILIPHALTFPGAFAPDGLLGAGVSTTAWIYIFWRLGLPIAVILYVLFKRADAASTSEGGRPAARVAVGAVAAVALVVAFTVMATVGHDLLPQLYLNRALSNYPHMIAAASTVIALAVVSIFVLFRHRRTLLDVWLLVVMSAWLVQTLLFLSLEGRFTISWYFTDIVVLVSHIYLMLALIAESSTLYAKLAIATSARNREREARLMSMDAVAAAISHEVGQPLSAVTTSASAGLTWLSREKPDLEKVGEALAAALDAGRRSFDVLKSTRAMFTKGPAHLEEFDLNDLVRESVALLSREMAAKKISVQLVLGEGLPPIVADKVQLQQVLVNLLTNAMESIEGKKSQPKRIEVRSAPANGSDVLLEVSDTGAGIPADKIDKIFDAFFTTKGRGTGLGLSLCRTIVEERGGRLWASTGEKHGATFHLQLPAGGFTAR